MLLPLRGIFEAFDVPSPSGAYRMAGLLGTEITLWQDVRFEDIEPFVKTSTLLVWLEGLPFTVALPQNNYTGDYKFTTATPVFMKGPHLITNGKHWDDKMVKSRFQHFELLMPVPVAQRRGIPTCPRCFANWVLENGIHAAHPPVDEVPNDGNPPALQAVVGP